MSVSSGSDVTIPIQDSPPPPPSPYGNRNNPGSNRGVTSKTPEPRGDIGAAASGVDNNAFQSTENQTNGHKSLNQSSDKRSHHTEIPMSGNSDSSAVHEAVNSELINMNVLDTIPQKPQPEFGPYENFDEYFISVNQHKKFLRRGEKLYVTKDKRKSSKWRKYLCWLISAFILAAIVTLAVLAGVGLLPSKSPTSLSMVETTTTPKPDGTITPSSQNEQSTSTSERQQSTSFAPDESLISSSTFATPVFDNYVPSAADIQLTLDNGTYEDSLSDHTSEKFIELATDLEQKIKRTLEADGKLQTAFVRIMEFSPGSIVAKIRVGWVDDSQGLSDVQRFVSTLKTIGDYEIRSGTTTSYPLYNLCKVSNNACSNYCTFDYESLDFLCTCPDHLLLAEDKKTCQEIPQAPSSSPSAPSENITELETSPEPEVPSTVLPEPEDEVTVQPVIPEASPTPEHEIEVKPVSSTTISPVVEPVDASEIATNGTDEYSSSEETISPAHVLPSASESPSPPISPEDEVAIVTTNPPDVDYNTDVNPELTPDRQNDHHIANSTDKFAQFVVSEPSIHPDISELPVNPSTEEPVEHVHVIPIDEIIQPLVTSDDPTSSTTTTVTPLVEVVETNTTSAEGEYESSEEEVETVVHNSSDTNRSSRLILESPRSENFQHGAPEILETHISGDEHQHDPFAQVVPTIQPSEAVVLDSEIKPTLSETEHHLQDHVPEQEQHQPEVVIPDSVLGSSEETQTEANIPAPEVAIEASEPTVHQSVGQISGENRTEENVQQAAKGPEENLNLHNDFHVHEHVETPEVNLTSLVVTPTAEKSQAEGFLPTSAEVEILPTGVPPRPHITSDEFMAFSDANMSLINAKLNLNKTIPSEPSSASIEGSSYESVSGDDPEISSHSEETLPSHPNEPSFPTKHREIEEVTTIVPISLINDTAVNNLTENVTEDLVNSENIFPISEETVTENSGSREAEHGEGETQHAVGVTEIHDSTSTIPTKVVSPELPEPNPIEQSKPETPEKLNSTVTTTPRQSGIEDAPSSHEILETTPLPLYQDKDKNSVVFSTTIPILTHLVENESSAEISQTQSPSTTTTTTTTTISPESSDPSLPSSKNTTSHFSNENDENELQ